MSDEFDITAWLPNAPGNLSWSKFGEAALPYATTALGISTGSTGLMSLLAPMLVSKAAGRAGFSRDTSRTLGNAAGLASAWANRSNPLNPMTYLMSGQFDEAEQARDWEQAALALPAASELLAPTESGLKKYFDEGKFTIVSDNAFKDKPLTYEIFSQIGAPPSGENENRGALGDNTPPLPIGDRLKVRSGRLGPGEYYVYSENGIPVIRAVKTGSNEAFDMENAQLQKHLSWLERARLAKHTDRHRWVG